MLMDACFDAIDCHPCLTTFCYLSLRPVTRLRVLTKSKNESIAVTYHQLAHAVLSCFRAVNDLGSLCYQSRDQSVYTANRQIGVVSPWSPTCAWEHAWLS